MLSSKIEENTVVCAITNMNPKSISKVTRSIMSIYVCTYTTQKVKVYTQYRKTGVFSWEHGCPALQADSLSMFRFMSSSVTRPAVTLINSAVVQTPSYRVWPSASSISRQLCLYTSSSFSLSLSRWQTTTYLPSLCGRHWLSLLAVSFSHLSSPSSSLSFNFLFSSRRFIIDSNERWQELDVSFAVCSFFYTAAVKADVHAKSEDKNSRSPPLCINMLFTSCWLDRMVQLIKGECHSCCKDA